MNWVTAGSTNEYRIQVEINSEYYVYGTIDYQDLQFNTDTNLYVNENKKKFDNGDFFEIKIYDVTILATPTIVP
jgi:hypothetical protein